MSSKLLIVAFICLLSFQQLVASDSSNTGAVTGKIVDKSNSESVVGAIVRIKGTTKGAITDIDGKFIIADVLPGQYTLEISCLSYQSSLVENVTIEKGKMVFVELSLEQAASELKEVTVTASKVTSTELSMLASIKASSVISNGITSQQIVKSADKDASEVVRRLPGITIMDDRFVIVRGLNQRYNNVWLNNMPVPSSEADVKSFSFDGIPSAMIDNLMVSKTTSADVPGEFAGGFIKVFTKDFPDKNSVSVSYGASYRQGTTFAPVLAYQGGKYDWLGIDGGERALPSNMPAHLNQYDLSSDPAVRAKLNDVSKAMNQNWTTHQLKAIPDQRASVAVARLFKLGDYKIGNISSLSYSYATSATAVKSNNYTIYNYAQDRPSYNDELSDNQYTQSSKIGLLHNWTISKGNTKIEFRNLLNIIGQSRATTRDGVDWYNNGELYKSYESKFVNRTIYSGQLGGEHSYDNTLWQWNLGFSYAKKNEPDTKRYRLNNDENDPTKYYLNFGDMSNPDLSSESRMSLKLTEYLLSASSGLSHQFEALNAELKGGLYVERKYREFDARNFGYSRSSIESPFSQTYLPIDQIFTNDNFNLTNGIKLVEVTGKSDSYTAGNTNMAGYMSLRFNPWNRLNVTAGLRTEYNQQTLHSYKQGQNVKINVDRTKIDILPSINAGLNLDSKTILRLAYGMSVNRPEFREIAPFYYVDFDLNAGIYGNPNLKQATIHNFDFRLEFYPSSGETVTLALFYKYFDNPIEQVILGNNPTQYSFKNVQDAKSYGLELEARKALGNSGFMKNMNLVFNGALIKSQVDFAPGELTRSRPMQGQSPYIINTGLYYQDDQYTASLLYNIIGKRIVAIGRPSPNQWEDIPNMYEMPRHSLDFNISRKIGERLSLQVGVKNILDQAVKYVQQINTDVNMSIYAQSNDLTTKHFEREQVTKLYYPHRYFSLGLSFKF